YIVFFCGDYRIFGYLFRQAGRPAGRWANNNQPSTPPPERPPMATFAKRITTQQRTRRYRDG
ncbi:MAG: hypothetical protein AB2556_21065, partial [Candidatus Thiodiazotropha sp.]